MTIAPSELADVHDDAELALAAARGDQVAFTAIYDRYADRLYDFCVGMLRDRDAAADCVQDVFVIAATKLDRLDDPGRLRGWLYAIARHQALERIRVRRRELPTEELPEKISGDPDPATLVARHELANLIAEAFGGLPDRDRVVYELAYRHGLDGPELADALGVSHTNANTLVGRLREGIERALGALLVCRSVRAEPAMCPELALLVTNWDGTFTVLMRKRAARHIDACEVCESRRRRMVTPAALLGAAPVMLPAPSWLRDVTLHNATSALPAQKPQREKSYLRVGLGASLVLLGIGGVMALDVPVEQAPVEPAGATIERSTQRFTVASTPASSAGVITVSRTSPSEPTPISVFETSTPTLTSAPTRTSAPRTTVNNSFEPSRNSTTRTRTRTSTPEPTSTGTMTATYLPGTPQTPTSPPSDPIE
jgi:RNA polymerase sigma factor (sigma-70 family)